ncbi:Structural maintenance of chromosomes protein [Quillaja saponaria]|uniref:Structural maintenance of chromosomes protein n=1 Tax=Quillaja saponaria TaxID=32244 RepID=A0AAD7Q3V5_QUISA|nr:Structural maintenance of chromosomes protein [Quillaja saponaria]
MMKVFWNILALEDIIATNKYVGNIDEPYKQLESFNESRAGVVEMVKLAEKETDDLEDVKNEKEAYMLKELSLLKWQEKATQLAHEDTDKKEVELRPDISSLEENLKGEREKIQESKKTLKELCSQKLYEKTRGLHDMAKSQENSICILIYL